MGSRHMDGGMSMLLVEPARETPGSDGLDRNQLSHGGSCRWRNNVKDDPHE